MKVNIVISNGHMNPSNGQTGTSGEQKFINDVFYALSPLLIKAGLVVYYDDANLENTKRLGNSLNYFLAIHADGATNPSYNGGFVDCNPDSATLTKDWKFAQTIADNYFQAMGIRFAPEHRTNNSTYYYAFNFTGENTVQTIIECGTLTNPDDKARLMDTGKVATLLSKGIVQYLTDNDATYQSWLKEQQGTPPSPTPLPDTTQVDELRKQLQTQKDLVASLTKEKSTLADSLYKCQQEVISLSERIKNIKNFIFSA